MHHRHRVRRLCRLLGKQLVDALILRVLHRRGIPAPPRCVARSAALSSAYSDTRRSGSATIALQQRHIARQQPLDRRAIEQVRRIFERPMQAIGRHEQFQEQIELGGAFGPLHRHSVATRAAPASPAARSAARTSPGTAAGATGRDAAADAPPASRTECPGAHRPRAPSPSPAPAVRRSSDHPRQSVRITSVLTKNPISPSVSPLRPSRDRRAHHHVLLSAPARQQQLERRQQHHVQRRPRRRASHCSCRRRAPPAAQPAAARRGSSAAAAADGRSEAPARAGAPASCSLPVRQLLLQHLALQPAALPQRVIRILHREIGQRRRHGLARRPRTAHSALAAAQLAATSRPRRCDA